MKTSRRLRTAVSVAAPPPPVRPLAPAIPLPPDWPAVARSGVLHAVALARLALVTVRGWCVNSRLHRVRFAAECEELRAEVALLREELRIKDARLARIPPRSRPHYPPVERLAILILRAARGWSAEQAARRFLLTGATIAHWMRRLNEDGEAALIRTPVPVNRFPDCVREVVTRLRTTFPVMGTQRIADTLARAGLHLAEATVRRFVRAPRPLPTVPAPSPAPKSCGRTVTAQRPNHVFNVDLTTIATTFGFWVPWFPRSLAPIWPSCWWIGVVLDHFSRRVVTVGLWRKEPTAAEVIAMLEAAAASAGTFPKHLISDHGTQFRGEYRDWCQARGVRPRFGAVGRYGSIAVLERFMRTLKAEGLRRLVAIPLSQATMTDELALFVDWYNEMRPHRGLRGDTPNEVYFGRPRARAAPRFEVRGPYPARDVELRAEAGTVVELHVERFRGREHLPVIELRRAA